MEKLTFISVSENVKRFLGYERGEIEGRSFLEFILESDVTASLEKVQNNVANKKAVSDFRNFYKHADGVHIVPMLWFTDGTDDNKTLCIAIPGEKIPRS